jgi:hypothetical protein
MGKDGGIMKSATKDQIIKKVEELRIVGNDFNPADVGYELGTTAKHVTQNIRHLPGIILKKKCAATRYGYQSSVWGFEKVSIP